MNHIFSHENHILLLSRLVFHAHDDYLKSNALSKNSLICLNFVTIVHNSATFKIFVYLFCMFPRVKIFVSVVYIVIGAFFCETWKETLCKHIISQRMGTVTCAIIKFCQSAAAKSIFYRFLEVHISLTVKTINSVSRKTISTTFTLC